MGRLELVSALVGLVPRIVADDVRLTASSFEPRPLGVRRVSWLPTHAISGILLASTPIMWYAASRPCSLLVEASDGMPITSLVEGPNGKHLGCLADG